MRVGEGRFLSRREDLALKKMLEYDKVGGTDFYFSRRICSTFSYSKSNFRRTWQAAGLFFHLRIFSSQLRLQISSHELPLYWIIVEQMHFNLAQSTFMCKMHT